MHRLLERQLRKARGPDGDVRLDVLLALVDQAYIEQERNRMRADRANELMATELTEMQHIRDVRDQFEREKLFAEAASAAKSQFIANMSHELRTPLNAVIGYTEMLSENAEEDGRRSDVEDHDRILHAARTLLHLINTILSHSKIESGTVAPVVEEFELSDWLRKAVDTILPVARAGGLNVTIALEEGLGRMRSDPHKLNQCILNLLSNSAKFTERGAIALRASRREDWIYIEVRDTGIGMTPEQLARVFSPFEQADNTITRRFGGTGLGLTITKQLVELLGGGIEAESTLGQGSRFMIRLPADMTAVPCELARAS